MCIVLRNVLRKQLNVKRGVAAGWVNPDNSAVAHKPKNVLTLRERWSNKMPKGAVWNTHTTPYVGS
jgi:hypothetical protein